MDIVYCSEHFAMTEDKLTEVEDLRICKSCGVSGRGKYCHNCGAVYTVKRITLSNLIHDVFHFFTHLDKGFGFTVKQLIVAPGTMQRSFIEGDRSRHQKPFSMFFISATLAALIRYWLFLALIKFYNSGSVSEADFSHQYMVMLQVCLVPVYTLITYLLFFKSGYNYAEIGVLLLYTISFLFLVAIFTSLLKLIWHDFDTAYVEFPIFIIYNTITLLYFFNRLPRWQVIIKSVLIVTAIFFLIQKLEDLFIASLSTH